MSGPTSPAREAARLGRELERNARKLRAARQVVATLADERKELHRALRLWIEASETAALHEAPDAPLTDEPDRG